MIVPWLTFVAVGLVIYAGFVKLAARLLRYRISWRSSFFFAVILLVVVIFAHVLDFRQPVATRIGHGVVLPLGLAILGAWFFRSRGTDRNGTLLGWAGGVRLMALAFAIMVVAFTIVVSTQVFSAKTTDRAEQFAQTRSNLCLTSR